MWRKWCDNKKIYTCTNIRYVCQSLCVSVSTSLWAKKVQRKRSKAPRDIINEGSATSGGGSSQNNNCRQFGGPRNCLFVKHFSLFDMSTSSSDRATRRTEPNWKTIETRAKFSFFLSLSLVSRFWRLFFCRGLLKMGNQLRRSGFLRDVRKMLSMFLSCWPQIKIPIPNKRQICHVRPGPAWYYILYYYPSLAAC